MTGSSPEELPPDESVRAVGETVLAVHYRTDPAAIERRLPPPLELIRGGEVMVYVVKAVINDTDQRATLGSVDPHATSFSQFCVTLPCEYDGRKGTYFTFHRVDGDTQLGTVRAMGYDSDLADVGLTRYPPELRPFASSGVDRRVSGTVVDESGTIATVDIDLESEGTPDDLPWPFILTVFSHRSIADETSGTGRTKLADDVLLETHESESISGVHIGEPTLELETAALADVRPRDILGGYYFEIGLVLSGLERINGVD